MEKDLLSAAGMLKQGEYTCVLCNGDIVRTTTRRGVAFLLELLDKNVDLRGFSAADKVVGKGAAFLYVLLNAKAVYAPVMSQSAKSVLEEHNIQVFCDVCPDRILNRAKTGYCPVESAVQEITSPQEGLVAIRQTLQKLAQKS